MLRSIKDLERYKVGATDGDLGSVADFLFDDTSWIVRYLIADTGGVLGERKALIAPIAFREIDYSADRFRLALSMAKIRKGPSVNMDLPVSRQSEREYCDYYGYPSSWRESHPDAPTQDAHLRSASEINGYHLEATDGSIGHVRDLVVDDETWLVSYMVVATTNWWPSKSVLISPRWATRISWHDRRIDVAMTRGEIRSSPEWSATYPVDRAYAEELSRHYAGIPGWASRDRSIPPTPLRTRASSAPANDAAVKNDAVERGNAWAAAHEESQIRAADEAVIEDARNGRMP